MLTYCIGIAFSIHIVCGGVQPLQRFGMISSASIQQVFPGRHLKIKFECAWDERGSSNSCSAESFTKDVLTDRAEPIRDSSRTREIFAAVRMAVTGRF
jgi:hypothetical protein